MERTNFSGYEQDVAVFSNSLTCDQITEIYNTSCQVGKAIQSGLYVTVSSYSPPYDPNQPVPDWRNSFAILAVSQLRAAILHSGYRHSTRYCRRATELGGCLPYKLSNPNFVRWRPLDDAI